MTQRIDGLVAAKEGIDQSQLGFDGDDLDDLRARVFDPTRPDCVRAIEILAPVSPAEALQAAAQIVAGGSDGNQAAAALDAIVPADEAAVPLALAVCVSLDPVIARAAWLTLQQVARSANLPALAVAAQQTVFEAQGQAGFAQSVIAYRAGVAGLEIADPDPVSLLEFDRAGAMLFVESAAVSDADFGLLSGLSTARRYLPTAQASATTMVTCAGVDMLLALDADVRDALPDTLLQGPSLLALVGELDPFHHTCSVSLLVLTRPDGAGGVRVTVHDPGGEIVYAGGGSISDGAVFLAVQSVARPGAVPVALSATATSAGLVLTEAFSGAQVSPATPKLDAGIDLDDPPIV